MPSSAHEARQDGLRLAYVALTRARFAYVELGLKEPSILHNGRLANWDYVGSDIRRPALASRRVCSANAR